MIIHLLAAILIHQEPVCIIEGADAALCRPEGVAFAPDDRFLAIANSEGHSVTIYPKLGEGVYGSTPLQVVQNDSVLRYPHDLEFTPCGRFLAVASRDNNQVPLFCCTEDGILPKPYSILTSSFSALNLPAGLSFSTLDERMCVANRAGYLSLVFYNKVKEGRYETTPFYKITDEMLGKYDLSAPHAVAFAPDGKTFSVVHKRVCGNSRGKSAITVWDANEMKLLFVYTLGYECIHSITYHPSGKCLAVTNEKGDLLIFEETEPAVFTLSTSISVDKRDRFEGPKGVAFSHCGRYLAVTTTWPGVIVYAVDEN